MSDARSVAVNDIVIFNCDEFRDGRIMQFDGRVINKMDDGVDVLYLSGYRSRTDFIMLDDLIAKLNNDMPWVKLEDAPFSGHFEILKR